MSNTKNQKQPFDALAKVAVIGDSSVGKTNILLRYVSSDYQMSHISTIGIDFKVKSIALDGFRLKMQIWDTAGQQRFRNLTGTVYQGAQGIILVYSITDRKTFQNIDRWMSDVNNYAAETTTKAIIGNKSDLQDQRVVTKQQGQKIAKKYNAIFFETSAKENKNIEETFHTLAQKIKLNLQKKKTKRNSEVRGGTDHKESKKKELVVTEVSQKATTQQHIKDEKIKLKTQKQQKKQKKGCC